MPWMPDQLCAYLPTGPEVPCGLGKVQTLANARTQKHVPLAGSPLEPLQSAEVGSVPEPLASGQPPWSQ